MAEPSPTLASLSDRLIRVLPPAFLLLVVMNCMFLGVVAWVFDHNSEARNALLTRIVEKCLLAPSGRSETPPSSGLERG